MSTKIIAHEQPISRIFSNDYVFKIPGYQRPYAWTSEQAGELFDDLTAFMKARPGAVEEMPPYFLGSIVLIKAENLPDAEVIDGQQRLTTITLLLSAIRETLLDQGAVITSLLYEQGNQILGTQDRFRLSLRDRDREFFQRYVQRQNGLLKLIELEGELSDSQDNLRANARLYLSKLSEMADDEKLRLAQFIVTRCFLVAVATPDLDSAYRIFSVLNSRGLDLSATDILKAEIIGALPENQRVDYTAKWEDTEEDLGRESFGELFSHIRMIFRKAKPQGTLLKEFKDHVTSSLPPARFIDTILIPMAGAFEEITDAAYTSTSGAESVNESLKWLNRLEFNDWIPPAIAFTVRSRNNPGKMISFFKDLERLSYGLLIMRAGINDRIERFSLLVQFIEKNEDLESQKSPLQLSPYEQQSIYSVLDGPLYETLIARVRSAVLLRLDSLLSGGGATYDYPTVTVEHVLPQNPKNDSEWTKWFPGEIGRATWVHRLGNLALLTRKKNSAASNYDFERKKAAYFSRNGVSPFPLTTQVLRHMEWTPKIVEDRQKELMAHLEQHWRLGGRKKSSIQDLVSQLA
jgi:hypothetical protein